MRLCIDQQASDELYDDYEQNVVETDVVSSRNSYASIEKLWISVFADLFDVNGVIIANKAIFRKSYYDVILKCDICNSMEYIYSCINKHVPPSNKSYYREEEVEFIDDNDLNNEDQTESGVPNDVEKIIDLIHYLSSKKVPQEFVAGFLILMIKYIYK